MYFVFQGYAPTKEQLAAGEYTMSRFAKLYGMNYKGMITQSIRTLGRIFASLQLLDKQVYIRMVVVQRFFAARAQRENRKSKEYEQHSLPEYM